MNINLGGTYKSADVDDITEITFSGDGTTMTTTTATSGNSTDAVSGITEITFDGTDLGGGLPVELVSFYADVNDGIITLNWRTSTEVNNYGFDVERASFREDGTTPVQGWETLGFIEGHGNSNSPKEYSFIDTDKLSEAIHYRLKQIETDGSFEYSEAITVDPSADIPTDYALKQNYPNPFNPSTTITYQIPKDGFVTLKVYDVLGREVATLVNKTKQAGKYSVEFSSNQLSSGTYFYRLTSGDFTEINKMLMIK